MYKIFRAIIGCCAIGITVIANAQSPVSWWQGEGNLIDSIGTNNGFMDVTNITFSYQPGVNGQAFGLNGAYITVPDAPSLEPATMTLQAWIKGATSQSFTYIITK